MKISIKFGCWVIVCVIILIISRIYLNNSLTLFLSTLFTLFAYLKFSDKKEYALIILVIAILFSGFAIIEDHINKPKLAISLNSIKEAKLAENDAHLILEDTFQIGLAMVGNRYLIFLTKAMQKKKETYFLPWQLRNNICEDCTLHNLEIKSKNIEFPLYLEVLSTDDLNLIGEPPGVALKCWDDPAFKGRCLLTIDYISEELYLQLESKSQIIDIIPPQKINFINEKYATTLFIIHPEIIHETVLKKSDSDKKVIFPNYQEGKFYVMDKINYEFIYLGEMVLFIK